jgi:hypothetical protein
MRKTLTILVVLLSLVVTAYAKPKKDKTDVNITLDDEGLKGKPEAVMSAWMGYGLARANWVSEHVIGKSKPLSAYHRSLEEEVAGRESLAKIWLELKQGDRTLSDAYLDQLSSVVASGFLSEYVWVYLRSAEWGEAPQALRLGDFEKWKTANLSGHKVETLADVTIAEKAK